MSQPLEYTHRPADKYYRVPFAKPVALANTLSLLNPDKVYRVFL